MTVLFFRYHNICEPDMINTLRNFHIDIKEISAKDAGGHAPVADRIEFISRTITKVRPVFVFSINFFPVLAEICHIHSIPYLCWTVDSPILELFSQSIQHDTNRIFMFDRAQYEYFHPFNPGCIFHLPLAANTGRLDQTLASVSEADRAAYGCDISFVGSLYTEHNPLHGITSLPDYVSGYITAMVEASLKIYGCNFMEEMVTDEIIDSLRAIDSSIFSFDRPLADPSRYIAAHYFIGRQAAETERLRTLNELAKHFRVDLYTGSDSSLLHNVRVHGRIDSLQQMPKVFRLSKINLNITLRSIASGMPLRIFDILGCGGFLMTNYQPELTEHFEIGRDLEAYSSPEELVDKCSYYLSHETERQRIAQNGYQRVKEAHTYQKRLQEMLRHAIG